jgi:lipoprotein-releasing system permease protein
VYQSLLTRKYLTSKVMPLLAAIAVLLCVAMELIVWSVMGGFLQSYVQMGRKLMGDVAISASVEGIPHYAELMRRLREDPMVAAATPTIETAGLLGLDGNRADTLLVKGIDPVTFDEVTGFADTLWWRPLDKPLPKDREREDPRLDPKYATRFQQALDFSRTLEIPTPNGTVPGIILGIEVIGKRGVRADGGWITLYGFTPGRSVTVSVLSQDRRGQMIDATTRTMTIVNESKSGIFEIDANTVYVPLALAQRMVRMNEAKIAKPGDPYATPTPEAVGIDPARVTTILVRGKDPDQAVALRERCQQIYAEMAADRPEMPVEVSFTTWRDRNAQMIGAVEKETGLVMFIFGVISLTSIFLVLAIFWSMVSEKTKDIGVLRAIGATRAGIAWLWLRYGLAIGLVGALLGGVVAYFIVRNINEIHEWLGRSLGLYIWDPKVYYFTEIPNQIDWTKFAIIIGLGVLASVLGALVPAIKAARMDPVKALRFE